MLTWIPAEQLPDECALVIYARKTFDEIKIGMGVFHADPPHLRLSSVAAVEWEKISYYIPVDPLKFTLPESFLTGNTNLPERR